MNDMLATVRTNAEKQLKIKIEEYETRKPYKIYKYSLLTHSEYNFANVSISIQYLDNANLLNFSIFSNPSLTI